MTKQEQQQAVGKLMAAIAALEAQRTVLGDEVVETLLATSRAELAMLEQKLRPPALRGERKLVTVMFADIAGFTALAETMDPESVRDLVNACFECLVPIIERYGGTVDKFMGDEVMALFGAPVVHENDPERALRAALEMAEAMIQFNVEHGTCLGLHFGINTGLVVAGGIGTRGRQEYSVMGDAVNLAKRLEEHSAPGQILVGPDTYRLVAPLFEFEMLGAIQVKGKSETISIYQALALQVVPGRLRGIAGLESPLVGRQTEFQALQLAVERLQRGQGGVVTLVGEAGLGKSRLLAEVQDAGGRKQDAGCRMQDARGKRQENLRWVEGRGLSYGTSIAYLLWLHVLRDLLGMVPNVLGEAKPQALPSSSQTLWERLLALCPDCAGEVYPYLARLLLSEDPSRDADPETVGLVLEGGGLKQATFRAVERLIEEVSLRGPLVVVCEDLHWTDPTSIELLEHLLPLTERAALLFICLFRPETGHACWRLREAAGSCRHMDLWIGPLSIAESERLVVHLLPTELPAGFQGRILSHAEGNPLYMEEIIRSLIDLGIIDRDPISGNWRIARDMGDIAIPDTLLGVLIARIDRLPDKTKRVLQMAAVIGRTFDPRVLARIAEGHELIDPTLWEHLQILQQQGMLLQQARVSGYTFTHHLTQEAAYNSLLKKERRLFHRRVAESLEQLFPEQIEEQVGLLAYHWERAEELDKATAYLLRAGDYARIAYAHKEAIDYYRRALVFLEEAGAYERAARTLIKLGLTHNLAFDFRQARRAYEQGFALWQRVGEKELVTPLLPAPHALRVVWVEPPTLDPALASDAFSCFLIDQLFSGLVELSPELDVVPDMACSWEILDGGCKYVFYLRDDACWSDGLPLTAADVVYAWRRVLDPRTDLINACQLYDVKGARAFHQGEVADPDSVGVYAPDEATLVVELEGPTGYFLQLLTHNACYPVPRQAVERYGPSWTEVGKIVVNGPFLLEEWRRGRLIVLGRNPTYYGSFRGNVHRVELCLLTDWAASVDMYDSDRLDVLSLRGLSPEALDEVRQRHAGEYVPVPRLSTYHMAFDVNRPPFDDVRVRRALAMAVDRETLADVVLRSLDSPATGGFVPPGMPGHVPGIALPYDPKRAQELLAEAGYPGGRGFPPIEALTRLDREPQYRYLQAQWRENLGIDIVWQAMDFASFLDRLDKNCPHLYSIGWVADYADPDNFMRVCSSWSHIDWQHQAYQDLVERARRATDQVERMGLYEQAERLLVHELPVVPLTYWRSHLLVKPWVRRYPTSAIKSWFWRDVVIEPHGD